MYSDSASALRYEKDIITSSSDFEIKRNANTKLFKLKKK